MQAPIFGVWPIDPINIRRPELLQAILRRLIPPRFARPRQAPIRAAHRNLKLFTRIAITAHLRRVIFAVETHLGRTIRAAGQRNDRPKKERCKGAVPIFVAHGHGYAPLTLLRPRSHGLFFVP